MLNASGTCYLVSSLLAALELAEEADVVLGEETEVFNAVLEVGNTLNTESESVAAEYLAVYSAGFEDIGIDHTAAEDFDPAGLFAEGASFAAAYMAGDVHFGTGFSEGEIGWAEADLCFVAEHLFGKIKECLPKVSETDVACYV